MEHAFELALAGATALSAGIGFMWWNARRLFQKTWAALALAFFIALLCVRAHDLGVRHHRDLTRNAVIEKQREVESALTQLLRGQAHRSEGLRSIVNTSGTLPAAIDTGELPGYLGILLNFLLIQTMLLHAINQHGFAVQGQQRSQRKPKHGAEEE